MQMQQMAAMKAMQTQAASAQARPPEPGHMSRYGATSARDVRPFGRDDRRGQPLSPSGRPGLGADKDRRDDRRPLERRRDDKPLDRKDRSPPRSRDARDRRDSNRGKYMVKVSPFPYTTVERDYQQLRLRYPRLFVAQDFTKLSCIWPDVKGSDDVINYPLDNTVNFFVGDKNNTSILRRSTTDPLPKTQTSSTIKFNSKVMLLQGLPKDWLNALEDTHLARQIKFMCVKNSKYGLMCMGGMWQKDLDGGKDGAPDTKALIKTAIRCVKDTVDLDLSNVKTWHRFLEITYQRPAETYKGVVYPEQYETTVIFIPEIEAAIPDQTSYTARVNQLKSELDAQALAKWEEEMAKRAALKKELDERKAKALAAGKKSQMSIL